MTMLCDTSIRQRLNSRSLVLSPPPEDYAIQPASIDLRLDEEFRNHQGPLAAQRRYAIKPGEFLLGTTIERIEVPNDLVVRVEGKSSLGRKGILIHATAGFIDPGFEGQITLELCNISQERFYLLPGMYICQISIMQLDQPAARPYGSKGLKSHYQNQQGVKPSAL